MTLGGECYRSATGVSFYEQIPIPRAHRRLMRESQELAERTEGRPAAEAPSGWSSNAALMKDASNQRAPVARHATASVAADLSRRGLGGGGFNHGRGCWLLARS